MIVALALLARLTAGAEVCGRVPDCVIDVGRACAKKHLPRRLERAAAAKVVAARNTQDVDSDGCYTEKWMRKHLEGLVGADGGRDHPLMKELGESKPVILEKEVVMLEEELEMEPFVIKVQRAFRLVKFVYRKFGPLLFVDNESQASYGHIKFRHVLKPASWIAVAPSVSARRLVKFMDYYWELPKPEVLVTITGGAQDFALALRIRMQLPCGLTPVADTAAHKLLLQAGVRTAVHNALRDALLRAAALSDAGDGLRRL